MRNKNFLIPTILCLLIVTSCHQNKNYLVNFDVDGGSFIESIIVEENSKVSKPADPSRPKYTFAGWYIDNEEYNFDNPVISNITLKARWVEVIDETWYSFIFNTDYCVMDNEKSYKGDETNPITLNISLDDSHKSWCEMPDDLLILFGENEGEKDTDYTYSVKDDKKSATLSLCVKDNITVCARFTDSDNAFRINPSKWEEAVNMTAPDIKYVQRVYQLGLLSGISLIRYREDYLSPNVSYHLSREVQNIGDHSLPPVYEYYVQKDGDNYKRYSRDDINDEWKITDASSSEFITPYDLRISTYLDMGSVTYETIKDSFDKERQAYFFNVVNTSGYPYSAILSFFNNKLTFFSYEYFDSTSSRTEFGFASYTYGTITPTLPE